MNIVVSGSQSTARGTEYGAGQLLYELGFRFYTPTVNVTPSIPGSVTQKLDVYSIPALEYRYSDNWQFNLALPWRNVMRVGNDITHLPIRKSSRIRAHRITN